MRKVIETSLLSGVMSAVPMSSLLPSSALDWVGHPFPKLSEAGREKFIAAQGYRNIPAGWDATGVTTVLPIKPNIIILNSFISSWNWRGGTSRRRALIEKTEVNSWPFPPVNRLFIHSLTQLFFCLSRRSLPSTWSYLNLQYYRGNRKGIISTV